MNVKEKAEKNVEVNVEKEIDGEFPKANPKAGMGCNCWRLQFLNIGMKASPSSVPTNSTYSVC